MRNLMVILAAAVLLGGLAWYFLVGRAAVQMGSAEVVTCPVTGTNLDPAKAYAKTAYKGKTYYFCCAGCPEEFKKNPGKYIKEENKK